jgi:orotidine-5'-phosphate decarboxylase
MTSFVEKLRSACETNRSMVCVGLDTDPDDLPRCLGANGSAASRARAVSTFNRSIIDATAEFVCAYKLNLAFYEAEGLRGMLVLESTIEHIRAVAPGLIIIGDSKMGDIEHTAKAYAKAMFEVLDFDAVTINAWGGHDTAEPWLAKPERGAFIWCRGSNDGSADFQDLQVTGTDGAQIPLYLHMAKESQSWSQHDNLGLVMGATASSKIKDVRQACPRAPLLIPGIGAQGGNLEDSVRDGVDADGRMVIINSSRRIIYASPNADYAEVARWRTIQLNNDINLVLDQMDLGWSTKSTPVTLSPAMSFA